MDVMECELQHMCFLGRQWECRWNGLGPVSNESGCLMLRLTVTPKAEFDLTGIWIYTCEEWGADQADSYLD
jgi:hypothetical protein